VANIDWRDYEDLEEQAFEKMSAPTSKKKKSWKQTQEETYNKRRVRNKKRSILKNQQRKNKNE
jgi:hypothetical protein